MISSNMMLQNACSWFCMSGVTLGNETCLAWSEDNNKNLLITRKYIWCAVDSIWTLDSKAKYAKQSIRMG